MLTRADVIFAYKLLLDRSPESEDIIQSYVKHCTIEDLRKNILGSWEFSERMLSQGSQAPWFFQIETQRAVARILEHLASLHLPLWGKSVLQVGINNGLLTSFFLDRKCKVLAADLDEDALRIAQTLIRHRPEDERRNNVAFTVKDFDAAYESNDRVRKDVVFCYDALWKSKSCRIFLQNLAASCKEIFLLETRVAFGHDEELFVTNAGSDKKAMTFPTRQWLWRVLHELFPFVYVPTTQPRLDSFPLNWGQGCNHQAFGRAVFVASRDELKSPHLADLLLLQQSYAD